MVVKEIPSTVAVRKRAPRSSWPGSPACVTVTGERLTMATPFQAFCPCVTAV